MNNEGIWFIWPVLTVHADASGFDIAIAWLNWQVVVAINTKL